MLTADPPSLSSYSTYKSGRKACIVTLGISEISIQYELKVMPRVRKSCSSTPCRIKPEEFHRIILNLVHLSGARDFLNN